MAVDIHLDYLTEDEQVVQLCTRSWEVNAEGQFVYSVSSLAKEMGLSSRELGNIVYQGCDAYTLDDVCVLRRITCLHKSYRFYSTPPPG